MKTLEPADGFTDEELAVMAGNINHLRYADVRRLIADLRASRSEVERLGNAVDFVERRLATEQQAHRTLRDSMADLNDGLHGLHLALLRSARRVEQLETQLAACADVISDMEGDLYAEPPNGTK